MANYAFTTLKAKTAALLVDLDMDHSRDVESCIWRGVYSF